MRSINEPKCVTRICSINGRTSRRTSLKSRTDSYDTEEFLWSGYPSTESNINCGGIVCWKKVGERSSHWRVETMTAIISEALIWLMRAVLSYYLCRGKHPYNGQGRRAVIGHLLSSPSFQRLLLLRTPSQCLLQINKTYRSTIVMSSLL